jgi:hypothetical protein
MELHAEGDPLALGHRRRHACFIRDLLLGRAVGCENLKSGALMRQGDCGET